MKVNFGHTRKRQESRLLLRCQVVEMQYVTIALDAISSKGKSQLSIFPQKGGRGLKKGGDERAC